MRAHVAFPHSVETEPRPRRQESCRRLGVVQSMGHVGCALDNLRRDIDTTMTWRGRDGDTTG